MAPSTKGKKTKAEEALDFLSNLDNLDAPSPSAEGTSPNPSLPPASSTPRPSTDSARRPDLASSVELLQPPEQDEEAARTLAFFEAQIAQKRSPLTAPKPASRVATPAPPAEPVNVPSSPPSTSGWGSSFWSSAATAIQSAQKIADEGYKRVKTEGVQGVTEQLGGVDLGRLRKGAEERLGGIVKGVDLEKLRESTPRRVLMAGHDLMTTTSSTLNTILNTVAPPISAHETLELWLSHPMVGYAGVEGVVYRAWTRILEQTESGELIVVWSPHPTEKDGEEGRSINPVDGFQQGWETALVEIEGVKRREEKDPQGRARAANRMSPLHSIANRSFHARHHRPDLPPPPAYPRTPPFPRTSYPPFIHHVRLPLASSLPHHAPRLGPLIALHDHIPAVS